MPAHYPSPGRPTFIIACLAVPLFGQAQPPAAPDFQREIRPLLAENCFQCHGPDPSSRMAGLRLDLKSAALQPGKRGAALVPGSPAESLLYQRIAETRDARRMPPLSSRKSLSPAQIALLKRWIEQGAPWTEHWSFRAPVKPAPPAVANPAWARTPVDRFILARLEARKLAPAPEANRRTLIRRAALDLTGLPPKPAEIEAFLGDPAPGAYERMLDRYLASPHYGEHRARYWLDAARYGDTHGIHIDNYREIWPYRDWVIQAFNRNQPFDQFTIEQLAGDLLPFPTLDQRIATGFHRSNVTTNEAGIIEDEYAEIYAKDRADTTAAVWLGLTAGCATCHDHKFDPITQKDFYSLGAFFRNTVQKVMDDNIPNTPPVIVVPLLEDRAKWDKLSTRLAAIQQAMLSERDASRGALDEWIRTRTRGAAHTPLEEKSETFRADLRALAKPEGPATAGDSPIPGRPALHFAKSEGVSIAEAPQLDAEKPFTISVGFFFPKAEQGYTIAARQNPKDRNRGWVIDAGARVAGLRLTGEEGRSIEIRAGHLEQLVHGSWNHLVVSYDGSRHQSGLSLYLNGRAIPTQGRGATNLELRGSLAVDNPLILGRNLPDGAISDFRIFDREVTQAEAALLAQWPAIETALLRDPAQLTGDDRSALATYYLHKHHAPFLKLAAEQKELAGEARAIARRGAITHVMQERADQPAFAHVLHRGAYDQRRERVEANTPAILPPLRAGLPRNRLGLAQWLFAEENPLTARVTVNRLWQEIFGVGLVKTADDFGSQGEPPSHPELLDWLAADFRESGWDVKRFYKQLLLSAAYRQAALATPAKLSADPENRLLSRGPRFRLDGEMVRDYALAAAGLLVPQIGGPSVRPYQPDGVWEAVAMIGSNTRFYQRDSGDGLYRRSLYTFWKRSAPPASMEIFNAPSRESCTVRRERTNTPLQALVALNDPQFVEAARVLAERALADAATFDARLDLLSTRLLARPLAPAERRLARQAFDGYRQHYVSDPAAAAKLLATGERKPDPSLPRPDYAAFTLLASQLLNLDEALNK
jgi:mono/diheme cytochrome c family protein